MYGGLNSGKASLSEVTEHDINWTKTATSNTHKKLGTLTDYSFKSTSTSKYPEWAFPSLTTANATTKKILAYNVIPTEVNSEPTIFQYYKYESGGSKLAAVSSSGLETTAEDVAKVTIGFSQGPPPPSKDTRHRSHRQLQRLGRAAPGPHRNRIRRTMRMTTWTHIRRSATREDGFTLIVAILVLFIASLLVTAVFVSTGGDVKLTRTDTSQKQAYYAAMAGISAYKYELNTSANYWKTCPSIAETAVAGAGEEKYKVKTLPAESTSSTESQCKEGRQSAILETSGSAIGTFRIESTGIYGTGANRVTRSLIATFTHPGFLDYVYLTNYEVLDPAAQEPEPIHCEHYYKERVANGWTSECGTIEFAPEDKINGPMHTNDAAAICAEGTKEPTFGRNKSDKIEMNGGHYAAGGSCKNTPNILGTYTESGPTLTPPETDSELLETADYRFPGRTSLELKKGNPNTIAIINKKGESETKPFPANGVIYVANEGSCPVKYTPYNTNYTGEEDCGNVYVKGEYTESLTIAAQNDVIINGPITTTTEGAEKKPTGSATLGLIATNFVRIYHPVKKEYEAAHSTPTTTTPTIVYKEETPRTKENTLEQAPTVKEKTLEQAPTVKEKTLEQNPTTTEKTVEEAGTGSKKETCKSGFTYNSTKKMCVGKVVEETCPEKYTLSNKKCTEKVTEETCPEKYTLSNKKCTEKVTEETCPEKYTLSNKKCTEKVTEEYCNTGYTLTNKKCVATTGEETCGSGYKLNSKKQCVASCPNGQSYVEAEGLCVGKCESNDKSLGKGVCEYENSASGCDAENVDAAEDPDQWGSHKNEWGSLESPYIDAAILSTRHSFIVDNFKCGKHLGELNIWGAIAQFWRGPVGTGGGTSGTGYTKNYEYDERLKTLQPPDFLTPTSSELKLSRVTAAPSGFGEG